MITLVYLNKKLRGRGYKIGQEVSLSTAEEAGLVNRGMATGTEKPQYLPSKKKKEVEPASKWSRR